MPGGHVLVERLDGIGTGELTELLVHIVCTRAGIITDPDPEVLDLEGPLLRDLYVGEQPKAKRSKQAFPRVAFACIVSQRVRDGAKVWYGVVWSTRAQSRDGGDDDARSAKSPFRLPLEGCMGTCGRGRNGY